MAQKSEARRLKDPRNQVSAEGLEKLRALNTSVEAAQLALDTEITKVLHGLKLSRNSHAICLECGTVRRIVMTQNGPLPCKKCLDAIMAERGENNPPPPPPAPSN